MPCPRHAKGTMTRILRPEEAPTQPRSCCRPCHDFLVQPRHSAALLRVLHDVDDVDRPVRLVAEENPVGARPMVLSVGLVQLSLMGTKRALKDVRLQRRVLRVYL